jgi:hypothetical protein
VQDLQILIKDDPAHDDDEYGAGKDDDGARMQPSITNFSIFLAKALTMFSRPLFPELGSVFMEVS